MVECLRGAVDESVEEDNVLGMVEELEEPLVLIIHEE